MKKYLYLTLIVLVQLFCINYAYSQSQKENYNKSCTKSFNNSQPKQENKFQKDIIFSTKDINSAKLISDNNIKEKLGITGFSLDHGNGSDFIKVSNKLFIVVLYGDNNYYLLYIKNIDGKWDYKNNLDVTPLWAEPCDDGDQCKKEFEIFEDYLIHIKTKEISEGDTTKYEKYYRINKNDEFYEVKE